MARVIDLGAEREKRSDEPCSTCRGGGEVAPGGDDRLPPVLCDACRGTGKRYPFLATPTRWTETPKNTGEKPRRRIASRKLRGKGKVDQ
jgi:DnaJ-class molecular chaperone